VSRHVISTRSRLQLTATKSGTGARGSRARALAARRTAPRPTLRDSGPPDCLRPTWLPPFWLDRGDSRNSTCLDVSAPRSDGHVSTSRPTQHQMPLVHATDRCFVGATATSNASRGVYNAAAPIAWQRQYSIAAAAPSLQAPARSVRSRYACGTRFGQPSTTVTTTLTIGGVAGTFSSTTAAPVFHALTVNKPAPARFGLERPAGINCGVDCIENYATARWLRQRHGVMRARLLRLVWRWLRRPAIACDDDAPHGHCDVQPDSRHHAGCVRFTAQTAWPRAPRSHPNDHAGGLQRRRPISVSTARLGGLQRHLHGQRRHDQPGQRCACGTRHPVRRAPRHHHAHHRWCGRHFSSTTMAVLPGSVSVSPTAVTSRASRCTRLVART